MVTNKVLDVSHHNTVTSWEQVAQNVDAVIIRAGYRGYGSAGTMVADQKFHKHIQGALAAGIPVGIYWCSQALSDQEALEEARYCQSLIAKYKITYPVYLDSEHMGPAASGRADRIGKARRTQYGLTWAKAMRDYGYTVGLYCSESWFAAEIDGSAFAKAGFELWVAKYSTKKPAVSDIDAWQFTSSAKVAGVSGNADLSYFFKNYGSGTYRDEVKQRFGFSDATMDYLAGYQFADDLLRKLATAP
jgi:GH25 family lysozyme M1 (1,4-beta-N-acetylmuramidase)